MVRKLSSLLVSTFVCVTLMSAIPQHRVHNEKYHQFGQDDRISFPEGSEARQRPAILVEYFENGTTIATYADGTPVIRPATAFETEQTESNTRLTGSTSRHTIDASLPSIEPKCLAGDNSSFYCTKVENYPRSLIENLLRKNSNPIIFKSDQIDDLDQRFGGLPNDEPLCDFVDEVIYPESGITHDDIPFFIVNTQKQQGVRIERCVNPDLSCTSKISFPSGYTSVCRQNHVYRELISPTNDLTALEKRNFKFPSCCSCMLQRKYPLK